MIHQCELHRASAWTVPSVAVALGAPELVAAFPLLAQPRAKKIPDVVLRSFQGPSRFTTPYGIDPLRATLTAPLYAGSNAWRLDATSAFTQVALTRPDAAPTTVFGP
jgi:hypothetical protein